MMKKEKLINKFFEKLLNYADKAESFASDQVPFYVEEMLKFGAYEATTWFWIGLGALILFLAMALIMMMIAEDVFILILFFVPVIVFLLLTVNSYLTIKKIEIAPRVYIVEELKK